MKRRTLLESAKTAIYRDRMTAPVKSLMFDGLIKGRILDYGCGHSKDGFLLGGDRYDPYYFPEKPEGRYDTILCTYVLNVVDALTARGITESIKELLAPSGNAYITVRRDMKRVGPVQRLVRLKLPTVKENSSFATYVLHKN